MKTLLTFVPHHGRDTSTVYLDVSSSDAKSHDWSITELLREAKTLKRHVGVIVRQFGGNTFFTYDPIHQSSVETQLLASLVKPATQIQIDNSTGEHASWNI